MGWPEYKKFLVLFFETVSLCSLGCPEIHSIDQPGLETCRDSVSASWVLGLKACTTTIQPKIRKLFRLSKREESNLTKFQKWKMAEQWIRRLSVSMAECHTPVISVSMAQYRTPLISVSTAQCRTPIISVSMAQCSTPIINQCEHGTVSHTYNQCEHSTGLHT